ncbi:hypothetical protein E3N88_33177 [Mikania micrantha]|uniref:Uncharacterized protein n=1 Tax=Mikania micrantha TaxID=192012 RepID=A0A5N6MAZ6_9ASTR|nr:hypothetical protein E3N88_33177 [Mikania micrantha]
MAHRAPRSNKNFILLCTLQLTFCNKKLQLGLNYAASPHSNGPPSSLLVQNFKYSIEAKEKVATNTKGIPNRRLTSGIGASLFKHLRKEEVILRKQHCFRRITGSCRRLYKTTASEESSCAQKTKTSEVYPPTKTVADYSYGTKGTDTRHVGLNKDRDNM